MIVCLFIYIIFYYFVFKKKKRRIIKFFQVSRQDLPYTLGASKMFLFYCTLNIHTYMYMYMNVYTQVHMYRYSKIRYTYMCTQIRGIFNCTCIALLWLDFRCSRPLFPRMWSHPRRRLHFTMQIKHNVVASCTTLPHWILFHLNR
mgnify:CR=1 FL=1